MAIKTSKRQKFRSLEEIRDDIKSLNPIDVLSEYLTFKKVGNSNLAQCPFHDDHDPSLGVKENGAIKCFACDWKGDVIKFVQEHLSLSFKDALLEIAKNNNIRTTNESTIKTISPNNNSNMKTIKKQAFKAMAQTATQEIKLIQINSNQWQKSRVDRVERKDKSGYDEISYYQYQGGNVKVVNRHFDHQGNRVGVQWKGDKKPQTKHSYWKHYNENNDLIKGQNQGTRTNILPFFFEETVAILNKLANNLEPETRGNYLLLAEGEQGVETVLDLGFLSFDLKDWKDKSKLILETLINLNIIPVIPFDNDEAGLKFAKNLKQLALSMGMDVLLVDIKEIYSDIKEKGDLTDLTKIMNREELIAALKRAIQLSIDQQDQYIDKEEIFFNQPISINESNLIDIPFMGESLKNGLEDDLRFIFGDNQEEDQELNKGKDCHELLDFWIENIEKIPDQNLDEAINFIAEFCHLAKYKISRKDKIIQRIYEKLKPQGIRKATIQKIFDSVFNFYDKEAEQERLNSMGKEGSTPPASNQVVDAIYEEFRENILYNNSHKCWYHYGKEYEGIWSKVDDIYIKLLIRQYLSKYENFTSNFVNDVYQGLQQLSLREFETPTHLLPFLDGVYNLKESRFEKHCPGNRLMYVIPRNFKIDLNNQNFNFIDNWLNDVTETQEDKLKLIYYFAAILRGLGNLQKFLHLQGPGGSGKSTVANLAEMLIGSNNTVSLNLDDLNDKFRLSSIVNKKLINFADQDSCSNKTSNFKSLTGNDGLLIEEKFKEPYSYRFQGLAIVTSNQPIFHTGTNKWLLRRVLQVNFNQSIPIEKQEPVEPKFEPELTAFTHYLLSIPESEIRNYLRGTSNNSNLFNFWSNQIKTDALSAWINEHLIFDVNSCTPIGSDASQFKDFSEYNPDKASLFGSFAVYAKSTGKSLISQQRFSGDLLEILNNVLSHKECTKIRKGTQRIYSITGIRLRKDFDSHIPTIDEILEATNLTNPPTNHVTNLLTNPKPSSYIDVTNPTNLNTINMNDQNFSSYTEKNIKTNSDSLKETSFEVGQVSHIPSHSDFQVGHMVGLPDGLPVGQVSRDENKIDDESIRDVAESLMNVHKAGLNLLRQIYPANLLKKASVLVKERNAEKYKQIKQWIFELDHLCIGDTVEIIETEDKGKRGTITTIKDSNGHSSGDRGIYNNCPKLGKEWSLTITFDDGSTETFYPDQVAKLD